MEPGFIILIVAISTILVAAIVTLVYFHFQKVEPSGKPIALNLAVPWATPSNIIFTEKSCEKGPDDRWRVTLIPRDIDINKKDLKVSEKVIVLGRDRRIEIGNLGFGAERNTYIYEPRSVLDLPSSFRKSILGKSVIENLKDKTITDSVLEFSRQTEVMNNQILSNFPTTIADTTFDLHRNISDIVKTSTMKKEEKRKERLTPWGTVRSE